MKYLLIIVLTSVLLSACSTIPETARGPARPIRLLDIKVEGRTDCCTTEALVAAIFVTEGYVIKPDPAYPKVVIALYADGTLVWSDNPIAGGAPYHLTSIPQRKVMHLLKRLDSQYHLSKTTMRAGYLIPDAGFTTILLKEPHSWFDLQSPHELFEQRPNLVAANGSVRTLEPGETRKSALEASSSEYRRFREVWDGMKSQLMKLIPKEGNPAIASVTLSAGYVWLNPSKSIRPVR